MVVQFGNIMDSKIPLRAKLDSAFIWLLPVLILLGIFSSNYVHIVLFQKISIPVHHGRDFFLTPPYPWKVQYMSLNFLVLQKPPTPPPPPPSPHHLARKFQSLQSVRGIDIFWNCTLDKHEVLRFLGEGTVINYFVIKLEFAPK